MDQGRTGVMPVAISSVVVPTPGVYVTNITPCGWGGGGGASQRAGRQKRERERDTERERHRERERAGDRLLTDSRPLPGTVCVVAWNSHVASIGPTEGSGCAEASCRARLAARAVRRPAIGEEPGLCVAGLHHFLLRLRPLATLRSAAGLAPALPLHVPPSRPAAGAAAGVLRCRHTVLACSVLIRLMGPPGRSLHHQTSE